MSAASTPTSRPSVESAAARLTASDDLPTPPFPETTAITRVAGSSWIVLSSAGRPPRSFVVNSARSSGVMTSKSSRTDETPWRPPTSFATWSWNDERSGQPATVSAIRTLTSPPSTAMSRTMSSSVIGLRSSGSITFPSALRTASRNGCISSRGYLEQFGQPRGVARRESLPVVVEVRVDVGDSAPATDPVGPLVELTLRVIATDATRAVMKAEVGEAGCQLLSLKRLDLRTVGDHERHAPLAQQ